MKKQSVKSRLHEHLGATHPGKKKQSMAKRVHESEGMEKEMCMPAKHANKASHKSKKMKRK